MSDTCPRCGEPKGQNEHLYAILGCQGRTVMRLLDQVADLKRIVGQQEQELHAADEVLQILAHAYTMSEQEAQNAVECARMIAADDARHGEGRP